MTTPSQTVGPFFHDALPYDAGPEVVPAGAPGAFTLSGCVYDGNGDPVADALVEIWQADPSGQLTTRPGIYDAPTGFRGFGRCATDDAGRFWFRTVKPAAVPTADGEAQAPHIAMLVLARGLLRHVVTRVYFPDETAANAADPLLSGLDEARRATLIASPGDDGFRFDVWLQGEKETVFLDVFTP